MAHLVSLIFKKHLEVCSHFAIFSAFKTNSGAVVLFVWFLCDSNLDAHGTRRLEKVTLGPLLSAVGQ